MTRDTPLMIPERSWEAETSPPSALFHPEHGVVPMHGRDRELEELFSWCRGEEVVQVRLYTGADAVGKKRLAIELCRRLRDQGWWAGWVDAGQAPEELGNELEARGGPRLLVLDQADTRREFLLFLLREIVRFAGEEPVRLLLLALTRLDWWAPLEDSDGEVGELLRGPATSTTTLGFVHLSPEERVEAYFDSARIFGELFAKPVPTAAPQDLDAPYFEQPLFLDLKAFADVEGIEVRGEEALLDFVLDRERRFWQRLATARGLSDLESGIARAVAAVTLGGGVDTEERAVMALAAIRDFEDRDRDDLIEVARLLHQCYPGTKWIEPLVPDVLGERLVQIEMEKAGADLLDLVLGPGEQGAGGFR